MNAILSPTQAVVMFEAENPFDSDERPEYKLKIVTFANRTVDMVITKLAPKKTPPLPFHGEFTSYPKIKTEEELEATRIENIERSARRAKQSVSYLVRQINADHMLTISMRENESNIEIFDSYFVKFLRLVREKDLVTINGEKVLKTRKEQRNHLGLVIEKAHREWAYVAVREYQQRGALHMHIACTGRQDLSLLRACWQVALGGDANDSGANTLGNIDVQFRERKFSGKTETYNNASLVSYLTKYISKTFELDTELGQRRYKSSRFIPKPHIQRQFLQATFSYGDKPFVDALKECYAIAEFIGIDVGSIQPWNRGFDVAVLRGVLDF
jgi:hypothetical protein